MEWYAPLTILPALGLIIMSTTNFIIALNAEIMALGKEEVLNKVIINLKLSQLRRLGIANALMYLASLQFLVGGIVQGIFSSANAFYYLMMSGVITSTVALSFLLVHSFRSVQIRQKHLGHF